MGKKPTEKDSLSISDAVSRTKEDPKLAHYKARARLAERTVNRLQRTLGSTNHMVEKIVEAVQAAPAPPRYNYSTPKEPGSPVSVVSVISDWHIGQQVSSRATEGFGGFNSKIARGRIYDLARRVNDWTNIQRRGYPIDDIRIFSLSDHISGDIHDELKITNEFPLPIQTERAGNAVGEYVRRLSANFKSVKVYCNSADNHSRLVRKPQAAQKAENSMAYLVHVLAKEYCRDLENVEFELPMSAQFLVNVQGWKFLLEHGDTVRGWSGIPHYGLQRKKSQEALKRMNTKKGFDYWCIGHFHTPDLLGNLIMNGALTGTTEYDSVQGRHSPPCQVAFLVHPKYGVFNFIRFWL